MILPNQHALKIKLKKLKARDTERKRECAIFYDLKDKFE